MSPRYLKLLLLSSIVSLISVLPTSAADFDKIVGLSLFYSDPGGKFILQATLSESLLQSGCKLKLLAAESRQALRVGNGLVVYPGQFIQAGDLFPRTFEYSGISLVFRGPVYFQARLGCGGSIELTSRMIRHDFSKFVRHGAKSTDSFRSFVQHLRAHVDFGV